jgi:pyrrolysine biosynthesis protein PylC
MKVLCLGAGLQGLEVAYLGLKAGWDITLIDKRYKSPASGLAETMITDLTKLDLYGLAVLCNGYDLIVPALEDRLVLERLTVARAQDLIPPLAFDIAAYRISSSKILSKKLFRRTGLLTPRDLNALDAKTKEALGPNMSIIVKPSGLSGSKGVKFFENFEALDLDYSKSTYPEGLVVEEWIEGNLYSVEVTAINGEATSHQVTLLGVDDRYDCREVIAPSRLHLRTDNKLKNAAEQLASELKLTGLMDLEAIYRDGKFYLLEIDARFPSQTPMAVYWSTGVNLLVELASCFVERPPDQPEAGRRFRPAKKVVIEQFFVVSGKRIPQGERMFRDMGPVKIIPGFMGSREALVAGNPEGGSYAVTLINVN